MAEEQRGRTSFAPAAAGWNDPAQRVVRFGDLRPGRLTPTAAPDFCESGAKAVAEEATRSRIDEEFLARHSIANLPTRSDFWLGEAGHLTSPMIKRPGGTHYEPINWNDAFSEIAREHHLLDTPDEAATADAGWSASRFMGSDTGYR